MSDPADTAKAIKTALEDGARDAALGLERGLERGLVKADAALATPDGADLAPLLGATDLPELPQEGALGSLGVRLDREADLFRNIALRELSRVAWMDRLTMLAALLAFLGEGAIAACATASTLVGAVEGRGGLFALAAIVLAGAAGGTAAIVANGRKLHHDLATDALARARSIEEQIFQLAVVMEWRSTEAPLFQDALARLERRADRPQPDA